MSVAERIAGFSIPTLLVWAEGDPMVHMRDVQPNLANSNSHTQVRWLQGRHVHFPEKSRAMHEVMRWLQLETKN